MKFVGLGLMIFGPWWSYLWRADPVEGAYMRPFGILIGIVGLFVLILGVRNDILQAVRDRDHPTKGT